MQGASRGGWGASSFETIAAKGRRDRSGVPAIPQDEDGAGCERSRGEVSTDGRYGWSCVRGAWPAFQPSSLIALEDLCQAGGAILSQACMAAGPFVRLLRAATLAPRQTKSPLSCDSGLIGWPCGAAVRPARKWPCNPFSRPARRRLSERPWTSRRRTVCNRSGTSRRGRWPCR